MTPRRRPWRFYLPLTLVVASCQDGSSGTVPPPVQIPPAILAGPSLRTNPEPAVRLSALVHVETDVPTRVELAFDDGVHQWSAVAEPEYHTRHTRVPVLGMRQGRRVEIEVLVRDRAGNATTAPNLLEFTPWPLPTEFPPLQINIADSAAMEPGVTLFNVLVFTPQFDTFLIMVDETGEVIWYYDGARAGQTAGEVVNAFPLPNGNLMLISGRHRAIEMNLLGDVVQTWWAEALGAAEAPSGAVMVDAETFHHEIAALPDGQDADFLVLGSELRNLPDYPIDEVDPTQTVPTSRVVGDTIVEFKRDGTVVRELSLLDILDPYRVSYDSLANFWNSTYITQDTEDWAHANGMVFDPTDNTYIVSLRHQDAVAKIARDGELVWLLGDPARWNAPWNTSLLTPVPGTPFEWSYHQHAPEITQDGTLLLFDNGNGRAIPPTPPLPFAAAYSRAVEYRIDAQAMTVEQVWAYGGVSDPGHSFYSFFVGDANRMPTTGNVLVTDGGKGIDIPAPRWARVVEVTHETPPREVFELVVRDDDPVRPVSYAIYRAYRLPGVYPIR